MGGILKEILSALKDVIEGAIENPMAAFWIGFIIISIAFLLFVIGFVEKSVEVVKENVKTQEIAETENLSVTVKRRPLWRKPFFLIIMTEIIILLILIRLLL